MMIVGVHKLKHSKRAVAKPAQNNKAYHSLVNELINNFNLSIPQIQLDVGVSTSTVYRWLGKTDKKILHGNYQKLLSLYCRCYLEK